MLDGSGSIATISNTFGFGRADPDLDKSELLYWRRLSGTSNDKFWEAEVGRYNFYEWDAAGTAGRALMRRPKWFAQESGTRNSAPFAEPQLAHIEQDSTGLLWVFLYQPTGISFQDALQNVPPDASKCRWIRSHTKSWRELLSR
ncbi:MAG: hypothetical protein WEE89_03915 [Gemmatimonadota bacterium]